MGFLNLVEFLVFVEWGDGRSTSTFVLTSSGSSKVSPIVSVMLVSLGKSGKPLLLPLATFIRSASEKNGSSSKSGCSVFTIVSLFIDDRTTDDDDDKPKEPECLNFCNIPNFSRKTNGT